MINALTSGKDHIPYRDSKLTRLLQESLGGNFKTTLMVAASPHPRNFEETISTLKFAMRAKTIKNKAKLNIKRSSAYYIKVIEGLKKELLEKDLKIKFLTTNLQTENGELFNAEKLHRLFFEMQSTDRQSTAADNETSFTREPAEIQNEEERQYDIPNLDICKVRT